jgi:hypothetical protein
MVLGMELRDAVLERVKRPALRVLHASPAGEAAILRVYLEGEEHAERAVLLDTERLAAPDWLARWLVKHRADEARHAEMLKARIAELTGKPAMATGKMDPVSRWKMRRLEAIARRAAPRFRHGLLVPLLATAWRMERMGVRVFARHVEVLEGKETPTLPMLRKILRDEKKHVAACEWALARLVSSQEWNDLQRLVLQIDRVERAFGVLGAVILFTMGALLWLGSSTSRSLTPAAT